MKQGEPYIFRILTSLILLIPGYKRHSFFVSQLVRTNIIVSYRKSFIGLTWLFLAPLFSIIIWIFMHESGVFKPGQSNIPYSAFVLLSSALWTFFIGIFQTTSNVITSNNKLLITANVPYHTLITSKCLAFCIQFFISFVIILLAVSLLGGKLSWTTIFLPFTLIPLLLLGLTLGMWNALFKVVAVDASRLFEYFMNFLKFATPIVFTPTVNSTLLQKVMYINPLTDLFNISRNVVVGGPPIDLISYAISCVIILLLYITTLSYFNKKSKLILERMIIS